MPGPPGNIGLQGPPGPQGSTGQPGGLGPPGQRGIFKTYIMKLLNGYCIPSLSGNVLHLLGVSEVNPDMRGLHKTEIDVNFITNTDIIDYLCMF